MARKFKTVNYADSLQQTVTIGDCLALDHLARFILGVIGLLDLSRFYAGYAPIGGQPFAPEVLLGLLLYGYATGVFSSRKLETATYEFLPFRFIAGGLHPDHSTIAEFRKTFLAEITELFVQVLVLAREAGSLKLGNISLDSRRRLQKPRGQLWAAVDPAGDVARRSDRVAGAGRAGGSAGPARRAGRGRGNPAAAGPADSVGEGASDFGSAREGAGCG